VNEATPYIHNIGLAFESVVRRHGDRVAIRLSDGAGLTYTELSAYSARLARVMARSGIGHRDVVALFVEKGPLAYGAMLACLRLGAIYTHLDRSSPAERQRRILDRCRPVAMVVDMPIPDDIATICDDLGLLVMGPEWNVDGEDPGPLPQTGSVTGEDPAYIMFTSGSTGFPKGAVITHEALLKLGAWAVETYGLTAEDVLTNVNPLYFDNSVFDFYAALLNGCCLAAIGRDEAREAQRLVSLVEKAGCSVWFSVPSLLIFLITMRAVRHDSLPTLRACIFGGEGYPKPEMKKLYDLFGGRVRLFNVYGPTECTCICSSYEVTAADFDDMHGLAPLGHMAPNFTPLLLDGDFPVASGEPGELCLLGTQVGLGYYNDPERTGAAFTANPLNTAWTERMYRTGDLVVLGEDGLHRFIGRKDNQIKHMGYRIELEEIDKALYANTMVTEAAAAYVREHAGFGRIVAAVATDQPVAEDAVRSTLRERLPGYMVPSDIKVLKRLPKNANGKIDRNRVAGLFQS
jgi:D-alanine--poly(phosphoribitol) ligase subunit 1